MHSCQFTRTKMRSFVIELDHIHRQHFSTFELLVALMSSHVRHEQSLQTNSSCLLILQVRHEQFLQTNSGANLPVSTKPPRHRGDCAKGARKVFTQAATGRHPLQSSCNPRRANDSLQRPVECRSHRERGCNNSMLESHRTL